MAAHEAADDDGEEEGEGYAEQVAAGRDGADEHHLVHLHGADDELMQRHTQRKARQRPDEGQQVDLAEDVAVDRAIYHLTQRGVKFDLDSKNVKNGKTVACYFADEIGGFAFHLVQA